jgi:hypothetical protein
VPPAAVSAWYEPLRPLALDACAAATTAYPADVVLFFLARWCQKSSRALVPCIDPEDAGRHREMAMCIAANLDGDGARVERLVASEDTAEWDELLRVLRTTAARRVGGGPADEYAREALQRIAVVLLTGTPPSLAIERLVHDLDGPRNEYVFQSPFLPWARRLAINLIIDDRRARDRSTPKPKSARLDTQRLRDATAALPDLVQAIRLLPTKQRAAVVVTLTRVDLDELLLEHLHSLAPDLFPGEELGIGSSDEELAARLGTTARRLAANRSAARGKLATRDARWELLLDQLMPHASTVGPRSSGTRDIEAVS